MKLKRSDGIAVLVAAVLVAAFLAEVAQDGLGLSLTMVRKAALIDADILALVCAAATLLDFIG